MIVDEMVTASYPPGTHVMRDGELLDGREFEGTIPVRRMTDRKLRRERERVERTRGQPVEFARSSHFDVLIPIYGDGTVGDPALYLLSTDDLQEGPGRASKGGSGEGGTRRGPSRALRAS